MFRELLYPWQPWFALHVVIHEAVGKSNDLVFRSTLSGSDASCFGGDSGGDVPSDRLWGGSADLRPLCQSDDLVGVA